MHLTETVQKMHTQMLTPKLAHKSERQEIQKKQADRKEGKKAFTHLIKHKNASTFE